MTRKKQVTRWGVDANTAVCVHDAKLISRYEPLIACTRYVPSRHHILWHRDVCCCGHRSVAPYCFLWGRLENSLCLRQGLGIVVTGATSAGTRPDLKMTQFLPSQAYQAPCLQTLLGQSDSFNKIFVFYLFHLLLHLIFPAQLNFFTDRENRSGKYFVREKTSLLTNGTSQCCQVLDGQDACLGILDWQLLISCCLCAVSRH